ncbi:hypothetical protein BJ170DRAFT_373308 [Xylariales sp. AK1849]|nr:hypothetical protein BJ170DRAFT_373308 [Xylariales sp. AK1849]
MQTRRDQSQAHRSSSSGKEERHTNVIAQIQRDVSRLQEELKVNKQRNAELGQEDRRRNPKILEFMASTREHVRMLKRDLALKKLDLKAYKYMLEDTRATRRPSDDLSSDEILAEFFKFGPFQASGSSVPASGDEAPALARVVRTNEPPALSVDQIKEMIDENELVLDFLYYHLKSQETRLERFIYDDAGLEDCEKRIQGLAWAIKWREEYLEALQKAADGDLESLKKAQEYAKEEYERKSDEWNWSVDQID